MFQDFGTPKNGGTTRQTTGTLAVRTKADSQALPGGRKMESDSHPPTSCGTALGQLFNLAGEIGVPPTSQDC